MALRQIVVLACLLAGLTCPRPATACADGCAFAAAEQDGQLDNEVELEELVSLLQVRSGSKMPSFSSTWHGFVGYLFGRRTEPMTSMETALGINVSNLMDVPSDEGKAETHPQSDGRSKAEGVVLLSIAASERPSPALADPELHKLPSSVKSFFRSVGSPFSSIPFEHPSSSELMSVLRSEEHKIQKEKSMDKKQQGIYRRASDEAAELEARGTHHLHALSAFLGA